MQLTANAICLEGNTSLLGNILIGSVASTMLYAIYMFAPELVLLTYINTCFDFILMSMLGCCAYMVLPA